MKKILLFLSLSVFAISCNNDFDVEARPEAATVDVAVIATQSTESVCSYDVTITAVGGNATIYYVVLPSTDSAPTSSEIFEGSNTQSVVLLSGASTSFTLEDLDPATSYTVYAVSVNKTGSDLSDGIRSEEVYTTSFTTSDFTANGTAIAAMGSATSFSGVPTLGGNEYVDFQPVVTPMSSTEYQFDTFWGNFFVSDATGNPAYDNLFTYPGVMTINPNNTVTIVGTAPQAYDNGGGSGTYDPCTNSINYTLTQTLFTGAAPVNVVLSLN